MAVSNTQIQQLYVAYFARPADPVGLNFYATSAAAQTARGVSDAAILDSISSTFALSAEYTANFTGMSAAQTVNQVYQNLFSHSADLGGLLYWSGKLQDGSLTVSNIVRAISQSAVGANNVDGTAFSSKVAAAESFTASLTTAEQVLGYSGTSAGNLAKAFISSVNSAATLQTAIVPATLSATVGGVVTAGNFVAGQTFTLTTGVNTFTGSTGADSFDASLSSASTQTWQASDALVGGAGTDTITATLISSVTPVTMTGIEVLNLTANTNQVTVNLTNATGVTNVNSVNSTSALIVSGITTAVTPSISDTAVAHTLTYTGVSGSADAETVNVSGMATGATLDVAGIELLTLNAVTSASTITTLTASTATTLTATGDQALTITAVLPATVNNVTASTKTAGGLTVAMGAVTAATLVGGAGADSFTFTGVTGNVNASGGAGSDTFTSTTTLTITDTITGGDGTDTISAQFATVSTAGYLTPTTRTITGIETLTVTDGVAGALSAVGIDTGITTVNMAFDGLNAAAAVTFNAGASTLNIGSSSTTLGRLNTSLSVVGATTDGDNITVKNNNVSTADAFIAINIAATGTETLTINTGSYTTAVAQTSGTVGVTGSVGFQSAETLVITGANVYTPGIVTADIINASAMTATVGTVYDGTAGTTAQTLTGSAGNDILVASTTSNVSINGGTGNDVITGGLGNDTLLGGAGVDAITSGAGNDSVDAGAGDDGLSATLNAADTLIGGDGTDTLTLDIIATAANAVGVSGWETIAVITGTQTMAAFPSTNAISRINIPTGATSVITNAGAAVVTLGAAAATTAITFGLANGAGTTDALTFVSGSTTDPVFTHAALTASTIENLTLSSAASSAYVAAGVTTITTLDAAAMTTLNITGRAGYNVPTISNATGLVTVTDTHTGSGPVTLSLTAATGALTYTGGAGTGATTLTMGAGANIVTAGTATTVGNFTVTGGAGAESITGGFGADSFSGGAGADTLIGGEGADTLQGGAGNDSLSGGAGIDQFESESGADTYDGGAGTDVLTITAGFTSIANDTITLIETLDMASLATTMTIAQANLFTTFSNQAAITFSDVGTVAANATVLAYTLAAGTNTITANAADLVNTFTGGTGADTFNFGLDSTALIQRFTAADVVNGTSGTDTMNFTGNIALTVAATNVSNIDSIVFSNTSTAVSWTAAEGNVIAGASLTLDGSAGTSGTATMTFDAVLETTGATATYNMIGGALSDTLTGGSGNDTISGSGGADSITGGAAVDNLSGGDGNDVFAVGIAVDLAVGEIMTGGNGTDTLLLTVTAVDLTAIAAANDNLVTESSIEQLVVLATTSAYTLDEAISGTALAISQTTNSTNVQTFTTTMVGTSADYSLITRAATTYGPAATATFALDATDIFVFTGSAVADTIKAVPGVINQITPGVGADLITMASGNDVLILASVATNGIDTVTGFTVGALAAGGDRIDFTAAAAYLNTNTSAVINVIANTTAGAANDNILLLNYGVYFADAAAVVLATSGVNTFGSGITGAAAHVLIAYQTAAGSAVRIADATVADIGGVTAATDLVILTGVTVITGLLAANFVID